MNDFINAGVKVSEGARSLSETQVLEILRGLDETAQTLISGGMDQEAIGIFMQSEIDLISSYFKLDKPFNEEYKDPDFVYDKSVIKYDKERAKTFVVDGYSKNSLSSSIFDFSSLSK